MQVVRRREDRGHAEHGWLDARHTFSFASYRDPEQMGFRALRVINEDRVAPGQGFGTHGHRDMEIITLVIDGALEHKDSMGNGSILRPGMLQRLSAGTGVTHSEFNHSSSQPLHLYQIWLLPAQRGIEPGYEELNLASDNTPLRLAVSPDGRDDSMKIHQDASIYVVKLEVGNSRTIDLEPERHAWIQVVRGEILAGGGEGEQLALRAGDGMAISEETSLRMASASSGEALLFDLA